MYAFAKLAAAAVLALAALSAADPPQALPTVYIYPMPARFNADVVHQAVSHPDEPWHPRPPMRMNNGFGPRLADGLFDTFAYAHELVLHQRLLRYARRVEDPEAADLLWVPFYASISAIAHRKDRAAIAENERAALAWLREHAPRLFTEPHRHVLAIGKVAVEHVGGPSSLYGSGWLAHAELRGVNVLSIERDAGREKELCAVAPHLRRLFANERLAKLAARRAEAGAELTAHELRHEAQTRLVLERPEEVQHVEICMVSTPLEAAALTPARIWAVPYNSIYAHEGPPRNTSAGEEPPRRAEPQPEAPWERQSARPLLAVFIGSTWRPESGFYLPQRVTAMTSCSNWAAAVSARARERAQCAAGEQGGPWPRQGPAVCSAALGDMELSGPAAMSCAVQSRTERPILRQLYSSAVFCLQPPGDTATRAGIFDSIVSGCIPVLWSDATLRQYELHIPRPAEVSLAVPAAHQRDALPWLAALLADDAPRVERMQAAIRELAPRCQYSLLGGRPDGVGADEPWDALEHALVGIASRRGLRRAPGGSPG